MLTLLASVLISYASAAYCNGLFDENYSIKAREQVGSAEERSEKVVDVPTFYIGERATLDKDMLALSLLCPDGYFGYEAGFSFSGENWPVQPTQARQYLVRFLQLNGIDPKKSTYLGIPLQPPKVESDDFMTWFKIYLHFFWTKPCFHFEELFSDPGFQLVPYEHPGERVEGELWQTFNKRGKYQKAEPPDLSRPTRKKTTRAQRPPSTSRPSASRQSSNHLVSYWVVPVAAAAVVVGLGWLLYSPSEEPTAQPSAQP